MKRGPGHSVERHPGFPGIDRTLQDRREPAITGGDWFVTPHHSPGHVPMALCMRLTALPERRSRRWPREGRVFHKGMRV